ncbi:hypothetical protein Taro_040207 [Colocasia esculenta]|uniref:Uncharacterized protein n=1 Tax=Colocasia esculenta TaxID=4460 RepID=A0A843WI09_COLES|nr:hypothetical protein [Colocasia esculenta]
MDTNGDDVSSLRVRCRVAHHPTMRTHLGWLARKPCSVVVWRLGVVGQCRGRVRGSRPPLQVADFRREFLDWWNVGRKPLPYAKTPSNFVSNSPVFFLLFARLLFSGEGLLGNFETSIFSEERYKHFYAKDESTHPSMVATHQHRFKGKRCKNVETVSTHVKSVSTRVAVDTLSEQVDTRSRSQNSQFVDLGQQVDTLPEQVDTGPSSQNCFLHILDSVSTLPPGQVDTLRKLFHPKVDGCHVSF